MSAAIAYEKRLFKVHSNGKVGDWLIQVAANDDGTATLKRLSTKVIGGKPVETVTNITKGKNIGRANETSPIEQALSEAKSKVSKQLDKGYVEEIPAEGSQVSNSLGLAMPMLAKPIEKVKSWAFPIIAQPKLDGHRMLATVNEQQEVVLYSRKGKPMNIPHIAAELAELYESGRWDGQTLDGELYHHGTALQTISSWAKRLQPDTAKLRYHVYDIVLRNIPYAERDGLLTNIFAGANTKAITLVYGYVLHNQEQLNHLHQTNINDGYEGTMVRWGDAGYEDGKRSSSLLKVKDFQDAEFTITGYALGKPYIRPEREYQVPVFQCTTENGKTFDVTAHGTMEEKDQIAQDIERYIGRKLTVKFFNLTPDGIPFLPVALRFYDEL
ncbi:hypothetical protein [Shewanella gaetbuli]|uniref:Polydeoxyribonucleotide synthase [ATP] n=1 Tax=Shewanella gaetbuli TaxID=220752 RepID=A0A9X2CIE6_9GAMM|nr:hypothetical protein [Shewanella gaetbuli]MCL1142952.1 hypothetical protein [Shewanella gaetbuli]